MSRIPSRSVRPVARGRAVRTPVHAGFRPAGAALAVAAVFALQPGAGFAQPAGAQVIAGQASFVRNGNDLVVTTQNAVGSNHSAINWQSFSVPAGSVTQFNQPSASSTSINRVVGTDPSAIFGTLRSNGRLVLVNPAGIAVGTGAVVDTAGFTASTLQMSETDAIAGRLRFASQGASGALTVGGTIRAQGGDIVLVAPNVQTTAEALVQSNGATVLAAGHKVEISGRGLEGIHLDVQAGDQAMNLGTLRGDAVGIFAGTLRHSGLVQAQAVRTEGGKVVLQASGGDALVNGAIEARGSDGHGGGIAVLGQRVGLLAGAALDASGAVGGGQVRVGGDYRGSNAAVPNAQRTYVDADATIRADATQQGNGGRVIVWSDEATRMRGQVSARGAGEGGNGGFVEVSGKRGLEFTGWVDLRAAKGQAGTLLLDPEDLAIVHDVPVLRGTLGPVYASTNIAQTGLDADAVFAPATPATASLSDAQLSAQLEKGNVELKTSLVDSLTAGGQISVAQDATVMWLSHSHLSLLADKGIAIAGTIKGSDAGAALHLQALNGSITEGASGVIAVPSLYATAAGTDAGAGSIMLTGANSVGRLAGDFSGDRFAFNNAAPLAVGTVNTNHGGGSGIVGSGATPAAIDITAAGGLVVESNASISGGSVALTATRIDAAQPGDLAVNGSVSAQSGAVAVDAAGSVLIGTADSTGFGTSIYGAAGASVTAGGSIQVGLQRGTESTPYVYIDAGGALTLSSKAGAISFGAPVTTDTTTLPAQVYLFGSGIDVQAPAGDVYFSPQSSVYSFGGPIAVTAGGSITGSGNFSSYGRLESTPSRTVDASITLDAQHGSLSFNTISSSGFGYGGFDAGNVTLHAARDITGGVVYASGGTAYPHNTETLLATSSEPGSSESVQAGKGGTVSVTSEEGRIVIGQLAASAGTLFDPSLPAAAAGSVTLHAKGLGANAADITIGSIEVAGGTAGSGTDGGTVTIAADRGDVAVARIATRGGQALDLGASAGKGGDVLVTASGSITLRGNTGDLLRADGGRDASGGHAADGAIRLNAGGAIVLDAQAPGATDTSTTTASALVATPGERTSSIVGGAVTLAAPAITTGALADIASTGEVRVAADALDLGAGLQSSGRTTLAAFNSATAIHLGGSDDGTGLALTQEELARIQAPVLTIGSRTAGGGIRIDGPVTLDESRVPTLTLLNAGAIGQASGSLLTVGSLAAQAGSVLLDQVAIAHALAGRSDSGSFEVDNQAAGTLDVGGAVDGTAGIIGAAAASAVQVTSKGALRLAGTVASSAAGNAVVLSGASLDAAAGSIAAPAGRWLVYLPGPEGNRFGSLASNNLALWNRSFAAAPPAGVTEGGNRYVFALQPEVDISVASVSKVYDGTAGFRGLEVLNTAPVDASLYGNVFLQDAMSLSAPGLSRNVGSYQLTERGLTSTGYLVRLSGGTLTITPRPLNVAVSAQDKVYDGSTAAAVSLRDDRIAGDTLAVAATAAFSDKNAGAGKTVTATFGAPAGADAGNYVLAATTATARANITPRTLNVALTAQDKVYDGTTQAALSSSDDRIAGDQLVLGVSGQFADKNVGTAKAVNVQTLLAGTDAGNYVLALPARAPTAAITPRPLHVSASAQDKVYDGTTGAVVSLADDRITGDALTLAGSAGFADANAGAGKTVSVQVASLTGGDAGNYVLAQPVATTRAAITPAALTITARDATKLEGDPLRLDGTGFTASGLVAGETIGSVTLTSAGADAAAKANRYPITPSAAAGGSGFLASNYDITYRDGQLTVLSPALPGAVQVNNQVVTFAQLFVQEAVRQQQEEKKTGKDDIVVTETACKP